MRYQLDDPHSRIVNNGKRQAAENGNSDFLPDNLEEILDVNIAEGKSTDNKGRNLVAAVSAGVHKHGNGGGQTGNH